MTEAETRALGASDLTALIGWLAVIETDSLADGLPARLERKLRARFISAGLLSPQADRRAFRQSTNDLNHRLRYALGEYA